MSSNVGFRAEKAQLTRVLPGEGCRPAPAEVCYPCRKPPTSLASLNPADSLPQNGSTARTAATLNVQSLPNTS